MANALLTPSVITKEALAILHQKLNFVTNINTQYDDQYAKSGAKIGNDLKIRLPNEFTVRSARSRSRLDRLALDQGDRDRRRALLSRSLGCDCLRGMCCGYRHAP